MRRIVFALLTLLSFTAMAQVPNKVTGLDRDGGCTVHDTFTVDPCYHYELWFHMVEENNPTHPWGAGVWMNYHGCFLGNWNYAADYTQIIGVSICGFTQRHFASNPFVPHPYNDSPFMQEWLQIYQQDSQGGKHLLASTPWSPTDTCYRYTKVLTDTFTSITDIQCCIPHTYEYHMRTFEYYFDKPVTVKDTFYVGTTAWSNVYFTDEDNHFHNRGLAVQTMFKDDCLSNCPDTFQAWCVEVYRDTDTGDLISAYRWERHPDMLFCIFPIIDTNYIPPQDTMPCPNTHGLGVEWIDTNCVFANWSIGETESPYQVNYTEADMPFESGITFECPNPYASICSLMTNKEYKLRVRSSCSTGMADGGFGPWSDTLFFSHPPVDPPIGIDDVEQGGLRLRPNPTRDKLTVERDNAGPATLEVFNTKGQKVLSTTTDQATVTLDVSGLTSGSYLLRVTTDEGSSIRTFVIKR